MAIIICSEAKKDFKKMMDWDEETYRNNLHKTIFELFEMIDKGEV